MVAHKSSFGQNPEFIYMTFHWSH